MCGSISIQCDIDDCSNFTRFDLICQTCRQKKEANINHLTGV